MESFWDMTPYKSVHMYQNFGQSRCNRLRFRDEGTRFLRNVCTRQPQYMAKHVGRQRYNIKIYSCENMKCRPQSASLSPSWFCFISWAWEQVEKLSKWACYIAHRKLQFWRDYYAEQCWILHRQRPSFLPWIYTTMIIAATPHSARERNFTQTVALISL